MRTLAAALILALAVSGTATAVTYTTATVERVVDGDTVDADGKRYRLIGLDAPEAKQEHGQQAKLALEQLVLGKVVDITVSKTDVYGRELGTFYIGETDINAEMVRLGHAWNEPNYPPRNRYVTEEREAICAHRGLWVTGPVPPWQFRDC